MQVVKHILKKTHYSGGDFYEGLLNYRTSPLQCGSSPLCDSCPGELLMNRRLRAGPLDFSLPNSRKITKRPQHGALKETLARLQPGDIVRLKDERGWSRKATVLEQLHLVPTEYSLRTVSSTGEIDSIYDPRRKPLVVGTYPMME